MKHLLTLILALMVTGFTAFGRQGIYVEYKISSASVSGTSKTYTSDGDTRSEMTMVNSAMPNPMGFVSLILSSTPGKVYTLNEKDKTYSEFDASKSNDDVSEDDYEITVLGNERINSYSCTHVKVLYKKARRTSEMWISKDVSGFADFTSVKNKYLGGSKFFNALKEKGAEGFAVRIISSGARGESMQMDLVKAEKTSVDASLFSLSGYTKSNTTAMPGAPAIDVNAIQKMTPEERQKYIEEMKEKYKR